MILVLFLSNTHCVPVMKQIKEAFKQFSIAKLDCMPFVYTDSPKLEVICCFALLTVGETTGSIT